MSSQPQLSGHARPPLAAENARRGDVRFGVALFFGWPLLFHLPLLLGLPGMAALIVLAATSVVYVRWLLFARDPARRARRRRQLRVGPLAPALPWVLLASVLAVAAVSVFDAAYARWRLPADDGAEWVLDYARRGPLQMSVTTFIAAGIVPVTEEMAFRGLLTTELERRLGVPATIVLSAVGFAVAHANVWAYPELFLGGLVLGVLGWAARSVWAPVIAHVAWNLRGVVDRIGGYATPRWAALVPTEWLVIAAAALLVAFGGVAVALRRRSGGVPPAEFLVCRVPTSPTEQVP